MREDRGRGGRRFSGELGIIVRSGNDPGGSRLKCLSYMLWSLLLGPGEGGKNALLLDATRICGEMRGLLPRLRRTGGNHGAQKREKCHIISEFLILILSNKTKIGKRSVRTRTIQSKSPTIFTS
jgi:hypothetical protein